MILAAIVGTVAACTSPFTLGPFAPPAPASPPASTPPRPMPRPEPPPVRRPVPPPAAEGLRPEQLTGLSRDETLALLGPPTDEATQAMATVWRYHRGGCALSLVFYPEVETAVLRVLSFEFEGGGDAVACLDRLHESRLHHGK